jgi:hypothetical protein
MLFINRLEFSCFAIVFDFLHGSLTPEREAYDFFKNPPAEGTVNIMGQKNPVFC